MVLHERSAASSLGTVASIVTEAITSSEGSTASRQAPRVSVVIPALNEALNLPHVFARMSRDVYEVILVDGGSADGTVEVARSLWPSVRVVPQGRSGKGDALRCGFMACRGDIIVMLDADGSADPAEIPLFVAALEAGADYAKGSRFRCGGGSTDITWLRRLGNWGLIRLVNVLFDTRYTDLCYGFNVFRTTCLSHIDVDCDGFEVETLMNIRVARAGLRVTEVPSHEAPRLYGQSKLSTFGDGWRVLRTIVAERIAAGSARVVYPAGVLVDPLHNDGSHYGY